MNQDFWHNAWAKTDRPGWQLESPNELLLSHWASDQSHVFVPLCGRSPDLAWLHDQGHYVIGVELSENAVARFFEEREIDYTTTDTDRFRRYAADRYEIYTGDFFALGTEELAGVTRVYDRAAMVAMPTDLRPSYIAHLQRIVPVESEWLVILLEYDQSLMNGPPFAVPEHELTQAFAPTHDISLVGQIEGDFKRRGVETVLEKAYRLHCKKA